MIKGIDTSKWQNSKVDYVKAKAAGYRFVFLRIGYSKTLDKCFEADYAAAIKAGLKVGVYFYTYSKTESQAVEDATRVLGWLNNRHLDLPVVYDVEDVKQKGTGRKSLNSALYNAFANKIRGKYEPMLYTGEYFFNNYFDKSKIKDQIWIAKYSDKYPAIGKSAAIWQYTSDAIENDFFRDKLDRNYLLNDVWGVGDDNAPELANPYPVPARTLKRTYPTTMKGNDVKWLQTELNSKGYNLIVDGSFGNATLKVVKAYQKVHGLKVDGKVGSATRYSLLND